MCREWSYRLSIVLILIAGCSSQPKAIIPATQSRRPRIDQLLKTINQLIGDHKYAEASQLLASTDPRDVAFAGLPNGFPPFLAVLSIVETVPGLPPPDDRHLPYEYSLLPGTTDVLTSPEQAEWQAAASRFAERYNMEMFRLMCE